MKRTLALATLTVLAFCLTNQMFGQSTSSNSGTVRGTVLDPSGGAVKGAKVEIQNPVSKFNQTVQTNDQGNFELNNIPFNNYHLSAAATGFTLSTQDIDVRSSVPLEVKVSLEARDVVDHCGGGC